MQEWEVKQVCGGEEMEGGLRGGDGQGPSNEG